MSHIWCVVGAIVALQYELFLAVSFITVYYELFLAVLCTYFWQHHLLLCNMSFFLSSISTSYLWKCHLLRQSHVLLGNYLFLVVPFVTVQGELFWLYCSDSVMCFGVIRTLSCSIAVQELVQGVSLVTVSRDVICSGNVSCNGTI